MAGLVAAVVFPQVKTTTPHTLVGLGIAAIVAAVV